jgi:hypothetical protein
VGDGIATGYKFDLHWVHNTGTGFRSISRMHIDVLTTEAVRTMIGISITLHIFSTDLTNEIFLSTNELSVGAHRNLLFA